MHAPKRQPQPAPAAACPPADELAAWRAEKAAERMALLRLPPEEAQAQADLFQAGRRDLWEVEMNHEAYLNRGASCRRVSEKTGCERLRAG